MHFLIMLKPILSNWAAEREEEREVIKAAQRDGWLPAEHSARAAAATHGNAARTSGEDRGGDELGDPSGKARVR